MNARKKGNRIRLKCKKMLEANGYSVEIVEKTSRWVKQKDLWGLFDLIAIRPNVTKLIQCKTNQKPNLQPFNDFKQKYPQFDVEVYIWFDRKGFTVLSCLIDQKPIIRNI